MNYQDYLNERRAKQFPDMKLEVKTPEEAGIEEPKDDKLEEKKTKKTNKKKG